MTGSTPAALATHVCLVCKTCFDSRNKLFKHVKKCTTQNQVAQQSCSQQLATKPDNVDTYLYAVGGRQRGRTLRSVERYSFGTQKWELCAQMAENRGSHGAGSIKGVLYAVGGGGFRSNLSSCEAYDGKEWQPSPPLCVSRHALAVTNANNDTIYAVGGWIDGKECSAVVERFRLGADGGAGEWVTVAPLNQARKLHAVTAFPALSKGGGVHDGKPADNLLYTFGGNCDDQHWHTNSAEVYDPVVDTWKFIAPMPAAGGASAAVVLPFVFVFLHGKYVLRYDPVSDSYVRLSDLPLLDWHCFEVVAVPNSTYIVALGGVSNGRWCNSMFQYDASTDTWSQLPSMRTARRRCASAIVMVEKPSADAVDCNEAKKQRVDSSL